MPSGKSLVNQSKIVVALHGVVPSSAAPKWVSLKDYAHVTVLVTFKNATTVTGSAIGLAQATAVAGTGTKTLAFTEMFANVDDASSVALTKTAVVSNTFTTDATNSKTGFYIIEVDTDSLDRDNGFDCFQVTVGNGTAATIEASYILGGYRYGGKASEFSNPLVD
jgi:hypothetical protein